MVPPPLVRRLRLTLVALLAVLGALGWRAATARTVDGPDPGHHAGQVIPFADVHPFGANFFLEHEVEAWKQRKTVELAAAAGIRWAKQHFPWSDIEPEQGRTNWDKYDRIVDLYRAHGLQVIARLDWPPRWVEPVPWLPAELRGRVNAPPADNADFARFVGEAVRHFRGRVRFYQIWNEPNLVAEWGANPAHPVNPAEYVALLAAAAAAARAEDPDAVVLTAPLAITTESPALRGNMSDLDYLDGMYEAGAAPHFDVLSANAFGMDRPPGDAPAATVLNFRRAELQRAVMVLHGDAGKAMWFNEYGWNAAPAGIPSAWRQVPEADQAEWTAAGARWAEANWPWAGVFAVWYFRQWGGKSPDMADYYFRMVDVDFTPRRLYGAVQAASLAQRAAGPGVWAEWSAPVELADLSTWRWQRLEGAQDGNALTSLQPDARLSFRWRGGALWVRTLVGADAGTLRVSLDDGGTGGQRGTLVPLATDNHEWAWVRLASGVGPGDHSVTMTVVGAGDVSIDAFRVDAPVGLDRLDGWLAGLASLALALAVVAAVDARRIADRIRV
jgi:polysaccharide biosynthesis protein PslG